MELVFITGMSGAGKSQAMKSFEDLGYFCIDNLPPVLISRFIELTVSSNREISKVAIVIDIRGREFFNNISEVLQKIKEDGIDYSILFLDANDDILIKRYKELRRPHPLSMNGSLLEGIDKERKILSMLRERANYIIDTTDLSSMSLRKEIFGVFSETEKQAMPVVIRSFGFKHGALMDADLVFDVRFLPNPFYVPELKNHNGMEKNVRDYVFGFPQTQLFMNKIYDLITFLIPHYINEGKPRLIIGIGCTGGCHRSVAISEELGRLLSESGKDVVVSHREIKGDGYES